MKSLMPRLAELEVKLNTIMDEDEEQEELADSDSSGGFIDQELEQKRRAAKNRNGFDLGFHSSSHKQGSDEQSSSQHLQGKRRSVRRTGLGICLDDDSQAEEHETGNA